VAVEAALGGERWSDHRKKAGGGVLSGLLQLAEGARGREHRVVDVLCHTGARMRVGRHGARPGEHVGTSLVCSFVSYIDSLLCGWHIKRYSQGSTRDHHLFAVVCHT